MGVCFSELQPFTQARCFAQCGDTPCLWRCAAGERRERAEMLLKQVGLGHRLTHKPAELSGGEQQRVAIARSLANNPLVILADEPTGNLDSKASQEIMGIFQKMHQAQRTIVLVTHEPEIAAYARRVLYFRDGEIVREEVNDELR
ncbi:MAG: ATP-binding cassette domain-containing protein [Syntrophaceticus schinkii]